MKRFGFADSLVLLVFAVALWPQTTAPKPDPEIKKFDVFLGHWTYTAEIKAGPLGPAYKVSGELSSRKILGGFFIENQSTEKGPTGETRAIEIIGYEPANKAFFNNEYQDDGTTASGTYVFNGNILVYTAKFMAGGKQYMLKAAVTPSADSMSITTKAEISTDGKAWIPLFEYQYAKAKPAPKK